MSKQTWSLLTLTERERFLASLSTKAHKICLCRWGTSSKLLTHKELAKTLGISTSRVQQIEVQAEYKLELQFRKRDEYLDRVRQISATPGLEVINILRRAADEINTLLGFVNEVKMATCSLDVRSRNVIELLGLQTLEQVAEKTEDELLKQPNFGAMSLRRVKTMLKKHGLHLKEDTDD